jgi:hypothetical protein
MDVVEGRGRKGDGAARGRLRPAEYRASAVEPQVIPASTIGAMRSPGLVLGVLLLGAGLVWMAQGLNLPFAPRSFMTADRSWIVIGAVAAVAGGILIGRARRSA